VDFKGRIRRKWTVYCSQKMFLKKENNNITVKNFKGLRLNFIYTVMLLFSFFKNIFCEQ